MNIFACTSKRAVAHRDWHLYLFFFAGISCASTRRCTHLNTVLADKPRNIRAVHTIQLGIEALAAVRKRTRNPSSSPRHRIQ